MAEECVGPGWDSLPPELLRRVVNVLLCNWAYLPPDKPTDCLRPIRATCSAWRNIIDADIKQLTVTVPSVRPRCLAENFPNTTHLDLSRYHLNSQDIFSVLEDLKLRSLVLADPWNPPVSIPTQFLQHLTHLSFLADGLLVTHLASQFCEALVQLKQLQELQLSRLQLSATAAQMLAQSLTELPDLERVVLSGGATPMHMAELYVLLNVELPQLHTLELTRLGVRMLPRSLSRLVALTRLTFSGEMMRSVQLQDELLQLTDLKVLDISANLAEQLPGCVLQLTGLRELHAGMNRLGMQAHNFAQMEELETLVLASNKLLALHSSVWGLTSLQRLDLGHNNLSDLPAEISALTGLTYLNVCHNFLTALPVGLAYLTRLVELDISLNTDMRELPAGLGALSLLTRLTASHMRLKQLPTDIGGMVALAHLDVSHNSLHHLAPQLSSLVALTHLEASDNKLHQSTAVPEELATLTALKVLRLARNRLQSLPEALGAFSALQVLDCSGNRLTSVPRVVGRCTALQQLLMGSNRLRGLTSGIGNLMRLQLLDLSHNQYRHLPTMTGDLTQLQELLLADNQLEDLPSSCSSLLKVTTLTLHRNRLHVLPPAICRMNGLRTLTLYDNPLLGKDAVVLQLQRQLPGLTIDSWRPLQGAALPPRLPETSGYVLSQPFMTTLLQHVGQQVGMPAGAAGLPAAAAAGAASPAVPGAGGVGPAGLQLPPHAAGAIALGPATSYAWPALLEQGYVPAQAPVLVQPPYDMRMLEAAMYAQLSVQDRQQQQQQVQMQQQQQVQMQQQQQQPALPGAFVVMRGSPLLLQGGAFQPFPQHQQLQPGAIPAQSPIQPEQQQQPQAGWANMQAPRGGFGPIAPARRAVGADAPPAAAPPAAAAATVKPAAPAPGQPRPQPSTSAGTSAVAARIEGELEALLGGTSAAAAAVPPPGVDAAGSTSTHSTPWASAGSQPGMNLQQLLAESSSPAGRPSPQHAAGPWGSSLQLGRQQQQQHSSSTQPPPLRRFGREAAQRRDSGDSTRAVANLLLQMPGTSAQPSAADSSYWERSRQLQEPAPGLPWRADEEVDGTSPWHRQHILGGAAAAAGTPASVAGMSTAGQAMAAGQLDNAVNVQLHAAAAAAAGLAQGTPQGVEADDAVSCDSMHSGRVGRSAAGATAAADGVAAAVEQSGVTLGSAAGAAAGEADAEETPSSAPDTECASDTSSEVADGAQPALSLADGQQAAYQHDFSPSVQRAVRGPAVSSSAGGSSSSGGGAQPSLAGASSCGGSSCGGHSNSAVGAGSRMGAAGCSRFQPTGLECVPVAAACDGFAPPALDVGAAGAEQSCTVEADAGVAADNVPVRTSEGGEREPARAAPASSEVQRPGRYFPFNVLEAAWWGS